MDIVGYIAALVIGFTLGLLGGGGSILTVPALVYLLGTNPVLATAYSLFVVGAAASVGAINNIRKGLVSFKTAIVFAIPSFIAVYLTRLWLIPALPDTILTLGDFVLTKDITIMVFFALIMLLAAFSMIFSTNKRLSTEEKELKFNYPLIIIDGLVVGVLTGIVGAGGGFLIIPALVVLARLPMKLAVGTSLTIIAVKSLIGFIGDVQSGQMIDWQFLLIFTTFAIAGIILGGAASNYVSNYQLKKGFGWFVLVMSVYIFGNELLA